MTKKNILIYGAGGVGAYFGGRLALNDRNDVTFVARGNYSILKDKGINIKSIDGDAKVRIKVIKAPPKRKAFDLIIITVKSYDTDEVIRNLKGSLSSKSVIMSLQNGVGNYDKLVKIFGAKRTMRAFCRIASEMTKEGIVRHKAMGEIIFGEENGKISLRSSELKEIFSSSGIRSVVSANIKHDTWIKFAWNCTFNIITAATMLTVEEVIQNKGMRELCGQLYDEIIKAAKAVGVKLTLEDKKNAISPIKNKGIHKTSTYIDRAAGKPLETDIFTGEILKIAAKNKLKLPINELLYSILKAVEQSRHKQI